MTTKQAAPAPKKKGATRTQQVWNKGAVGKPTAPRERPIGRQCPNDLCGKPAEPDSKRPSGMQAVVVDGPGAPARWYCQGRCATYGQALADIRSIPDHLPTQRGVA
ncbi:hypothetical protein ABZ404_37090 [Streptomyces sp. NPDC005878]|uniref:hypothetical protein n=1 Tax=Streptomyces sp. NPDC005878 TaxID=3157077 RepID=UPI00340B5FF0